MNLNDFNFLICERKMEKNNKGENIRNIAKVYIFSQLSLQK